jgi:hypothetical protein
MTFKLSKHAKLRKRQRCITNAEIEATIRQPDSTEPGHSAGTTKFIKVVGQYRIKVVVVDNTVPTFIVTVIKDPL